MYFADHIVAEDTGLPATSYAASALGWGEWLSDDPCSSQSEIVGPEASDDGPPFPAADSMYSFSDLAHPLPDSRPLPLRLSGQEPIFSAMPLVHENPSPRSSIFPPPVATACVTCRSRHLKCNGKNPCIRCIDAGTQCTYVASRRGYRPPSTKVSKSFSQRRVPATSDGVSRSTQAARSVVLRGAPVVSRPSPAASVTLMDDGGNFIGPRNVSSSYHFDFSIPFPSGTNVASVQGLFCYDPSFMPSPAYALQTTLEERSINAFYHYFFPAYPFVLPRENLLLLSGVYPIEPVLAAMNWIGSLYIQAGPACAKLFQTASALLYEPGRKKDGFLVQALLLLIIGLDGLAQRTAVTEMLRQIGRISVQIGLNSRSFAGDNGLDSIMSESWRRTWWETYIVDALISAARGTTKFLIDSIPAEAALPCEEHQYLSGDIPPPQYLSDMDDSDLLNQNLTFSSFAYCIQAARIIGRIAKSPMRSDPHDDTPTQMENLITSWRLNLPLIKRNLSYTDRNNRIDEMLFQAHMIIHAASIYLHQPYSQLATSRDWDNELRSACTPDGIEKSFNIHTSRVIHAAEQINQMITLPSPLLFHSHFFAYAIVISLLIHVGESASMFLPHKKDTIRQGIRLSIGALNEFGRVWYTAALGTVRIKTAAQELSRLKQKE